MSVGEVVAFSESPDEVHFLVESEDCVLRVLGVEGALVGSFEVGGTVDASEIVGDDEGVLDGFRESGREQFFEGDDVGASTQVFSKHPNHFYVSHRITESLFLGVFWLEDTYRFYWNVNYFL